MSKKSAFAAIHIRGCIVIIHECDYTILCCSLFQRLRYKHHCINYLFIHCSKVLTSPNVIERVFMHGSVLSHFMHNHCVHKAPVGIIDVAKDASPHFTYKV